MTGTDSLLPGYTPSSGGETPPPGGMRGEAADNPHLERPELRRDMVVERSRVITIEEASGTAFAEASGAVERSAATPASPGDAPQPRAPEAAALQTPLWQRPIPLVAAFAGGVLLAMLTSSTRMARRDGVEPLPAADRSNSD